MIKLDPFDDERRTKYLFEVLRKRYGYEGTLAELPQQLVAYVSDMAGGVPKHIEEVLKVRHDATPARRRAVATHTRLIPIA